MTDDRPQFVPTYESIDMRGEEPEVSGIVAFLRARLDDDERVAQASADAERCGCHVASDTGKWTQDDGNVHTDIHSVTSLTYDEVTFETATAEHIARWDPARVLAEVDTKRRIVTAIHDRKTWRSDPPAQFIDLDLESRVLELLAMPYAGHEDYREEWRP